MILLQSLPTWFKGGACCILSNRDVMSLMTQIRIPDDRTSRSNFGLIDDELEQQLRDILERVPDAAASEDKEYEDYYSYVDEEDGSGNQSVFERARSLYHSCMDTDALEEVGLAPLIRRLKDMGGWPVVEGEQWDEEKFDWFVILILWGP